MTHVMVDLETWGTAPGCDIRSIGACVFDPHAALFDTPKGEHVHYVACGNPLLKNGKYKYPLGRSASTVAWWAAQSADAQGAFEDKMDLREALSDFAAWLSSVGATRIWAHGPHFDVSILSAAYEALGMDIPYKYTAARDTRTAFDMSGVRDMHVFLDAHRVGTHHNALDDAVSQAFAVHAAMAMRDNGNRDGWTPETDKSAASRRFTISCGGLMVALLGVAIAHIAGMF